jgi:CheY-like chemotaxis protein
MALVMHWLDLNDRPDPLTRSRVLAIDDDVALRQLYVDVLELEGFEVITAANGAEGIEQLWLLPDVILLDLTMPIMDGYRFLEELQKREEAKTIPVLVVTAAPPAAGIAGARRVVTKPFDIDALSEMLRTYVAA